MLVLTVGLLGLWAVAFAGSAEAVVPPGCSQSGSTVTCTYTTPFPTLHGFTVPAGVSSLDVSAVGHAGGGANGGPGASVEGAHVAVSGGEILTVVVGASGGNITPLSGGFGGVGPQSDGGGASGLLGGFVRDPLVIAAGGGGGAGGAGGAGGVPNGTAGGGATGGGGATTTASGVGGWPGGSGHGFLGYGGYGEPNGGGGGGGGYFPGGGGGSGGGGGGGSSFGPPGSTFSTASTGSAAHVTISYQGSVETSIVLAKGASTREVHPGGVVSYGIGVTNRGTAAEHVTVSDDLSGVLDKATLEGTPTAHPGTVRVISPPGHLVWTGTLGGGETATINYSVRVHHGLHGGILFNGVSGPPGSTCASCMTETRIVPASAPGPNLELTKTASAATVHPGGQVTFQLVVLNHGPGDATGVTLEDPAPTGLVFSAAEPGQGHCTINRELRCPLGTIHAGGQALVQVTAAVGSDASGPIVNHATVWGNQGDPNQSNNAASSTVHVTPAPSPPPFPGQGAQPVSDLRLQLHGPTGHVVAGTRHTFTVGVTNHGPDPADGVEITFTASLPMQIISAHAVHDACTTTLPVRCQVGTVPAGGRVTLRIVAVPLVSGELRTEAGVMSDSLDPHPNSSVVAETTRISTSSAPTRPRPAPPRFTG